MPLVKTFEQKWGKPATSTPSAAAPQPARRLTPEEVLNAAKDRRLGEAASKAAKPWLAKPASPAPAVNREVECAAFVKRVIAAVTTNEAARLLNRESQRIRYERRVGREMGQPLAIIWNDQVHARVHGLVRDGDYVGAALELLRHTSHDPSGVVQRLQGVARGVWNESQPKSQSQLMAEQLAAQAERVRERNAETKRRLGI